MSRRKCPDWRDEPVIGIIGQKGSGMSVLAHRMIDLAYWKYCKK